MFSSPSTCAEASWCVLGINIRVIVSLCGSREEGEGIRYVKTIEFSEGEYEECRERMERWRSSDAVNLRGAISAQLKSLENLEDQPIVQSHNPPIFYLHFPSLHPFLYFRPHHSQSLHFSRLPFYPLLDVRHTFVHILYLLVERLHLRNLRVELGSCRGNCEAWMRVGLSEARKREAGVEDLLC